MFTEFDEQMAVERIADLHRERGQATTSRKIRAAARQLARIRKLSLDDAYEHIESLLLANNPRPENWS